MSEGFEILRGNERRIAAWLLGHGGTVSHVAAGEDADDLVQHMARTPGVQALGWARRFPSKHAAQPDAEDLERQRKLQFVEGVS